MRRRSLILALTLAVLACATLAPIAVGRSTDDDTLHVAVSPGILDSLDPALGFTDVAWQIEYATCVKLVNYASTTTPSTTVLPTPEAAQSLPTVSADGLLVTFTVPAGRFRFSPPSGEQVTAHSFKAAFDRLRKPALASPGVPYFTDVANVVVSGSKLTFTLTRPVPDLVQRLTMPFMCAIPVGTPAVASNTIPSAGPYYVRSADLNGVTVLRENPNYDGSRSNEFQRIAYTVQDATAITAGLTAGTIDYSPTVPGRDPWWAGFLAAHPDRVKVNAAPGIRYLAINSFNVPLPVRKAINYAIDRNALAALGGAIPDPAADHIIAAGVPGSGSAPFYPMNGNLATATALAAPYTATPIRIVYNVNSAYSQSIADAVAARLQAIGLTTTVTGVGGYFGFLGNPSSVWDVAPVGWAADYLDPDDFVDTLVKGGAPTNLGHFADPTFDARIDAAGQLSGSARYAAYKQLDDDLVRDAAPLAVYANLLNREPFSGRIGCKRFTTPYRIDLASLCEDDG